MSKHFTSALPPTAAPLPVPVLCSCVHAFADFCLAERWKIDSELAEILNGCHCRCHFTANGGYMPAGAWAANREQKRRDIERVKSLNEIRVRQIKKEIR